MSCLHVIRYYEACGHRIPYFDHGYPNIDCWNILKMPEGMIFPEYYRPGLYARSCQNSYFEMQYFPGQCTRCSSPDYPTEEDIYDTLNPATRERRSTIWNKTQAVGQGTLEERIAGRKAEWTADFNKWTGGRMIIEVTEANGPLYDRSKIIARVRRSTLTPEEPPCGVCRRSLRGTSAPEVVKEELCSLPCGHLWHRNCIKPWYKGQKICPKCFKGWMTMHRDQIPREPSYEDPVFQQTVVAPTLARQIYGYEKFTDPTVFVQPVNRITTIDFEHARGLFGEVKCEIMRREMELEEADVILRDHLIATGANERLLNMFANQDDDLWDQIAQ